MPLLCESNAGQPAAVGLHRHPMTGSKKARTDLLYDCIKKKGLSGLTEAERRIFALTWFCLETKRGGFHQFFLNDAGKFAADALFGLETVGATRTAEILRRAMALFPEGNVPADQSRRRAALLHLPATVQWEQMDALTTEFRNSKEEVAQLVETYIAAHGELFPALQH